MNGYIGASVIEAIFTALSFIFSVWALTHNDSRDKKKESVKMVNMYYHLVVPCIVSAERSKSRAAITAGFYSAMKYTIRLYMRIDSNLVNKSLIKRYLLHDVLLNDNILKPYVGLMLSGKYSELKITAKRYKIIVDELKEM